jgi:hypothetical protein
MGLNQMKNEERRLRDRQDQFIDDEADGYEEGVVTGFMEHKYVPPSSGINSFNVSFLCFSFSFYAVRQFSRANKKS